MSKQKIKGWKIEFELLDYGLADKFGDKVYADKYQIKKIIKDTIEYNLDNGLEYRNLKIKRQKCFGK